MSIGAGQIALIVLFILLIFGAGRLPRLMEDLAKGIKAFKKGMQEDKDSKGMEDDQDSVERICARLQVKSVDAPIRFRNRYKASAKASTSTAAKNEIKSKVKKVKPVLKDETTKIRGSVKKKPLTKKVTT